jgi:hypothetical protein
VRDTDVFISEAIYSKIYDACTHHVYTDREIFYAYCGNTAVDLDPLPVSRARMSVRTGLFE